MEHNLSYYKIFYTVAKIGNISKAAKELYISQPAISKAITKLEQNLNTLLFTRSSRGVQLTYEGNLLFEQCKIAFQALANGEAKVKNATELNMGHLRIGVSTTLCKYVLLPYLKRFMMRYPYVKISIECQSTHKILSLLDDGNIDIGLIAKPAQIKQFDYYTMSEIEDVFVASSHYLKRLQRETNCDLREVLDHGTLMLLGKDNITRQYVDSYLQENLIQISNLLEITSMDLLIEFAKIGIGIASVIKGFIKEDLENGSLIEIPLSNPIQKREIGFICSGTNNKTKSLQFFLDMMIQDGVR